MDISQGGTWGQPGFEKKPSSLLRETQVVKVHTEALRAESWTGTQWKAGDMLRNSKKYLGGTECGIYGTRKEQNQEHCTVYGARPLSSFQNHHKLEIRRKAGGGRRHVH